MFRKKKEKIAFLIGCIWYYIKMIEDVQDLVRATDCITNLAIKLNIDWNMVEDGAKVYATWDAFQSGCL